MKRYLDSKSKRKILRDLRKVYASAKNNRINEGLDISLIPFLKELNRIEGIVTIQSCIGHAYKPKKEIYYYMNADLWIWPSKEMGKKFYERAHELTGYPWVEKISTYYSRWGQEIISILFEGITPMEECDSKSYQKRKHEVVREMILLFFISLEKEVKEENKRR